jgi:hypothetical protein
MQWSIKTRVVAVAAAALAFTPALAAAQASTDRQEAIRQSLTAAQTSLSEMIKLPAAATLQGDVRTAVSGFIAQFNEFATLPKDWKAKYQTASNSLDKILADAAAAPASAAPAAPATPATPAPGAAPADPNAGPGTWDPEVVQKLKDVRTHLDEFEKATGDPLFMVWDIEELLQTSGADSGTVTLDSAKLTSLKELLTKIKVAAGGQ